MRIFRQETLLYAVRYGLLATTLLEWMFRQELYWGALLLFFMLVVVAQVNYFSLSYPWAILLEGGMMVVFCMVTQHLFFSLLLLLLLEISLRFSPLSASILQLTFSGIAILFAVQQQQLWAIAVYFLAVILFRYIALLMRQQQEMTEQLKSYQVQLQQQNQELQHAHYTMGTMKELYTLQERNRISREIHDSVGHSLSTIIIQLGAISKISEETSPVASQMSEQLREFAKKGLQEVRQVVHDLKPERLSGQQLTIALEEFFDETQKNSNVQFVFRKNEPTFPLTEGQELTIFRGIQEATSNAIRHGQASKITVVLMYNERELIVTISDNGTGSEQITLSGGLRSLQERLAENQANLTVQSNQTGYTVQMKVKGVWNERGN